MSIDVEKIVNDRRFELFCVSLDMPRHHGIGVLIYIKRVFEKLSLSSGLTGTFQKRVIEAALEWHLYECHCEFPDFTQLFDRLCEFNLLAMHVDESSDDPSFRVNY